MIVGSNNTFDALASRGRRRSPRPSRSCRPSSASRGVTFERLDEFQVNTRPLVQDLIPVARDLSPTLQSVRELSPNLRNLFVDLDDLNAASRDGPAGAARASSTGSRRCSTASIPFLANLNPVIDFL